MACKEAQELHGLAPKPAADLNPDDNQAAASGVAKFGVRLMPLAACRICHPAARLDVGARVCLTKTCEGGNNSGIDGELGSIPKREAVRDNLDAPLIGDGHVEVHVGEADVASADLPLPAALGGHVTIKSSDHSQGSRVAANTAKDCFNTRPSAGGREDRCNPSQVPRDLKPPESNQMEQFVKPVFASTRMNHCTTCPYQQHCHQNGHTRSQIIPNEEMHYKEEHRQKCRCEGVSYQPSGIHNNNV